jgi:hypothetical protein
MADAAIERLPGMELFTEESNAPFDSAPTGVKPFSEVVRTWLLGVGFLFSVNAYALQSQLFFFRASGLVCAIAQERTREGRLEQRIEADYVMAVTGN